MSVSFIGLDLHGKTPARPIHIAIGSTMSRPADIAGNLLEIAAFARRAAGDGADILLTPELSICGCGSWPDVMALAETAGEGPVYRGLADIARETSVVVCAGFPEKSNGKCFNAHYAVYPDGRFVVQRKNRPMPFEAPFESPYPMLPPRPGEDQGQPADKSFSVFEVRGVKCAMVICADSGVDGINELLASRGVELVLLATGGGGTREDRLSIEELRTAGGRKKYVEVMKGIGLGDSPAVCMEYRRAMAAVNICGYDGRQYYHGGNGSILNCFGELVAYTPFLPVLERQRPMYAHAVVDIDDTIDKAE